MSNILCNVTSHDELKHNTYTLIRSYASSVAFIFGPLIATNTASSSNSSPVSSK